MKKKNELQLALRNNSIISAGPTNPGRFVYLLTDIINLNYQNITRDRFNDLIIHMNRAYQNSSAIGCPYQFQTYAALKAILKFISEAFSEEFIILDLNTRFSALNFQWQPQRQKSSLLKSFVDTFCCFFSCCKSNDGTSADNAEIKPLLAKRNGF